ncbi:MAG: hypothetical protein RLZ72_28 [Actinomycetota bacterium]
MLCYFLGPNVRVNTGLAQHDPGGQSSDPCADNQDASVESQFCVEI